MTAQRWRDPVVKRPRHCILYLLSYQKTWALCNKPSPRYGLMKVTFSIYYFAFLEVSRVMFDLVLLCTGDCGVLEWGTDGESLGNLSYQVCSVIGQLTMWVQPTVKNFPSIHDPNARSITEIKEMVSKGSEYNTLLRPIILHSEIIPISECICITGGLVQFVRRLPPPTDHNCATPH